LAALGRRTGPDRSGKFSQIQVNSTGFNQNENKKNEAGPWAWKWFLAVFSGIQSDVWRMAIGVANPEGIEERLLQHVREHVMFVPLKIARNPGNSRKLLISMIIPGNSG